ncbi:MAG TPA: efflux transporter outer membrane subunit [Burkholderiaceae bacterium]|nr:efflux transporter outer membrane subunit [Burkholderiaceae bacterium]
MFQCHRLACLTAAASFLAGCAAGPDYVRPPVDAPAAYKEPGQWKAAEPRQIDADQQWWKQYGDARLDALIDEANKANQDIRLAEAQYRAARGVADAARAGFYPTVNATASAGRARSISNGAVNVGNTASVALTASWEPDLWGSVRRSVESGTAGAQASSADLAAARLSVQAQLAQDYFQLRATDEELDLLARTVEGYARALQLTQHQYAAGIVLRSDVALADTQLQTADAQRIDLQAQRAQLEHAIAILLGRAPAMFTLEKGARVAQVPETPTGLPSDLLERRPDIAGAERRVAQANANIGVARAAYYPSLLLGATGGLSSGHIAPFLEAPVRVWSLGAALAETLFDGGLRAARDEQAVAAYDASVAQYKRTVLGGFQEVEDNLAALRVLDEESAVQERAVQSSQLSERLALTQYRGGTATYLAVIVAQTLALGNERTLVQLRGRQLVASVALVRATGGGWAATMLDEHASAQADSK